MSGNTAGVTDAYKDFLILLNYLCYTVLIVDIHNKSAETVLADDFLGTAPDGATYTKAEEVKDTQDTSKSAQQCHQIGPRVRLFGDNVAMVYGNAFSARKGKDRQVAPRCIVFSDTWLKRDGKWQVIAAQDAQIPCRE